MLTERQIRAAKPGAKERKLFDEHGLYLRIRTSGSRSWRFKYRWGEKERHLTLGPYPLLSLAQAREERDDCRRMLLRGVDPAEARRRRPPEPDETIVEKVARRWHGKRKAGWTDKHASVVLGMLEKEVFPALGKMPIGEVTAADVRELTASIEPRSVEIAHRVRGYLSEIFGFAIGLGLVDQDPAAGRDKALATIRYRRRPAMLELERARAFLRAVEAVPSAPQVKLASRLLALTVVRPGVVRFTPRTGEWEDLEGETPLWRIPAARMKQERARKEDEAFDFLVPLSTQAADVIDIASTFSDGSPWLFPGGVSWRKPLSENAISDLYRRVDGAKHVPHGWRSSFSTIMNELAMEEERPADRPIIDLMLAHRPKNDVEAIYNRAVYMKRRRELAQLWADMLLEGFPPADELLDGPRKASPRSREDADDESHGVRHPARPGDDA